jgi:hypothetical protein
MNTSPRPKRIDAAFNVFLTAVMVFFSFLDWITDDKDSADTTSLLEAAFSDSLIGQGIVLLTGLVLGLVLTAVAVQQFWNRCVTDVFSLRAVTLAEAYAFSLVTWIILW